MRPSHAFIIALIAFFNPTSAIVIPANSNDFNQVASNDAASLSNKDPPSTTKYQASFPSNTVDTDEYSPYIILSSNTVDDQNTEQPSAHSHTKRKKDSEKKQVKAPYCPHPKTRPCITQKEVDQGWHDVAGCYNKAIPILTFWWTHCWEAGDDCIKEDCRY